jgi:predicted nucleotidyltransferase
MAKTALVLTAKELKAYKPVWPHDKDFIERKWQRAMETARETATILRGRFGATRVVAFGSLAHKTWFTPWSDIDIIAWGIPTGEFYKAVAVVTGISAEFEIDLIDPESCHSKLKQLIDLEGIEL